MHYSNYNRREGYLEHERHFADGDEIELVKGSGDFIVLPCTNVYDKGYRAKMGAWQTGMQLVLQQEWAESDKRFCRDRTLLSVAADRGGNGRAVKICKRAWFISRPAGDSSQTWPQNN